MINEFDSITADIANNGRPVPPYPLEFTPDPNKTMGYILDMLQYAATYGRALLVTLVVAYLMAYLPFWAVAFGLAGLFSIMETIARKLDLQYL